MSMLVLALCAAQGAVDPLCALEEQRLLASDGAAGDLFGKALALDGDTLLVGADAHSAVAFRSGAAYVFVRGASGWSQEAQLVPSEAGAEDVFGRALDLQGDRAVVGAPWNDLNAGPPTADRGAVFVFERSGTTWSQTTRIAASDAANGDNFGHAVALDGDTLAVGAFGDDGDAGAVYVFELVAGAWVESAKLTASNRAGGDQFGLDVALDGDTLAVGASRRDAPGTTFTGAAYVFERSAGAWSETAFLTASDAASFDFFGESVDVRGDVLAIGATQADGPAANVGAVYVHERGDGTWPFAQKLVGGDAATGDSFGEMVALDGELLAVGAPFDRHGTGGVFQTGSVTLFGRASGTWIEIAEIAPSGVTPGDAAHVAALSGGRLAVGSPFDGELAFQAGSAHVFRVLPAPATYCAGKPSSLGCVPFLAWSGTPSATQTSATFEVTAHDLLPGEAGFLIYGLQKANLSFHGGRLCVKAPFTRLLPPVPAKANGPPPCTGTITRGLNKRIQSGVDPQLSVGAAVSVQLFQRDPQDPAGFGDGLTDAVRFSICP